MKRDNFLPMPSAPALIRSVLAAAEIQDRRAQADVLSSHQRAVMRELIQNHGFTEERAAAAARTARR